MSFSSALALEKQLRRLALLLSNAANSSSSSSDSSTRQFDSVEALDVQSPMNITIDVEDEQNNKEMSPLHAAANSLVGNENNYYNSKESSSSFPLLPHSRATSAKRQGEEITMPLRNRQLQRSASVVQQQTRTPTENELSWVTSGLSVNAAKWDTQLREYPQELTRKDVFKRHPRRSTSAGKRIEGTFRSSSVGNRPAVLLSSRSPSPLPPLPVESSRRGSTVEDVAELRHRLRILKSRYDNQLQRKKVEEGKVARMRRPAPTEIAALPKSTCTQMTEDYNCNQEVYPPPSLLPLPSSPSRVKSVAESSFIGNSSMRSLLNNPVPQARSSSAPASPSRQSSTMQHAMMRTQGNSSSSDDIPSAIFRAVTTRPISRRFSSSAASTSSATQHQRRMNLDKRDFDVIFTKRAIEREEGDYQHGEYSQQTSPRGKLGPRLWAVYGGDDDTLLFQNANKNITVQHNVPIKINVIPMSSSVVSISEAETLLTPSFLLKNERNDAVLPPVYDVHMNEKTSRSATASLLLSKEFYTSLSEWGRAEQKALRTGYNTQNHKLELSQNDVISRFTAKSSRSTSKWGKGFFSRKMLKSKVIVSTDNEDDNDNNEEDDYNTLENEKEKDFVPWPLPSTGRLVQKLLSLADAGSVALLAQRAIALMNADAAVRIGSLRVRTLRAVRSLVSIEMDQARETLAAHIERLHVVSMEEESQRVLVNTFGPSGKIRATDQSQNGKLLISTAASPSAAYTLALLSDLKHKLILSAPFVAIKENAHIASTTQGLLDRRCSVIAKCGLKLIFARHAFASALHSVRLSAARAVHVSSRLRSTKALMASWHQIARESAQAGAREAVAERRGRLTLLSRAFRGLKANYLSRSAQRYQAMLASTWSRFRMLAEAFKGWVLVVRNNRAIHERMDAALLSEQRTVGRQSNAASATPVATVPVSTIGGLLSTPSLTSALRILRQTDISESFAQKYKYVAVRQQHDTRLFNNKKDDSIYHASSNVSNNGAATTVRNVAAAARGYALRSRQRCGLEETARSLLVRSKTSFEHAASLLMLPSLTSGGGVRGGATMSTVRAIDAVLLLLRKVKGKGERLNESNLQSVVAAEDRLLGALGPRFQPLTDALILIRRSARGFTSTEDEIQPFMQLEEQSHHEHSEEEGPLAANRAGAIRAAYASTCILDPVLVAHAKIQENKEASLQHVQSRSGLTWPYHSHGIEPLWTQLPFSLLGLPILHHTHSLGSEEEEEEENVHNIDQLHETEEDETDDEDPASLYNVGSDSLRMRAKALMEANRQPPDWTQFLHGASKARVEGVAIGIASPRQMNVSNSEEHELIPSHNFIDAGGKLGRGVSHLKVNLASTTHKILSPLTRRILSKRSYLTQAMQVDVSPVGSVDSSPNKANTQDNENISSTSLPDKEWFEDEIDDVDQTIAARASTIYALRLLKAVLSGWAKAARTSKLSKKLKAMWIDRRQQIAFLSWKRFHEAKSKLIASARIVGKRFIKRRYFLALTEYMQVLTHRRESNVKMYNRMRLLKSSFSAFQSFAALKRKDRALCAIADASNVKRLLQKSFLVWKVRFEALRPIRAFARKMSRINGLRAARLLWPAWRHLVDQRKLLRRVFLSAERRQNEEIAFEATRHERAFVALGEALHMWSAFAKEETIERRLRAAEYSAEAFWRVRRLVKSVITWKRFATVATQARVLRSRCLQRHARSHLLAWIGVFLKHRAALLRLQMRWEVTVPIQMALHIWRNWSQEKIGFKQALQKRLLKRWYHTVQTRLKCGIELTLFSKSLQEEILYLERKNRLKRSFEHWRKRAIERARIQALEIAATSALADRKKRVVLAQLAAWAERRIDLKRRIKDAGATPLHLLQTASISNTLFTALSPTLPHTSVGIKTSEIVQSIADTDIKGGAEALDLSIVEPPFPRLRTVLVLSSSSKTSQETLPLVSTILPDSATQVLGRTLQTLQNTLSTQAVAPMPLASTLSTLTTKIGSSSDSVQLEEALGDMPIEFSSKIKVTTSTQTSSTSPPPLFAIEPKAVVRATANIPLYPPLSSDYKQRRDSRVSSVLDSLAGSRRGSDVDTDSIEAVAHLNGGEHTNRRASMSSISSLDALISHHGPPVVPFLFNVPPLSIVALNPEFLNSSPEEERYRFWARTALAAERITLHNKQSPPPPPPPPSNDDRQNEDQGSRRGRGDGGSGGGSFFTSITSHSGHKVSQRQQLSLETSLTPHFEIKQGIRRKDDVILDRISSRIRETQVEERVVVLASRMRESIAAQDALEGRRSTTFSTTAPIPSRLLSSPPGILTASLLLSRGQEVDDDLDSLFAQPVFNNDKADSLVKDLVPNHEQNRLAQAVREATNRVSELLSLTSSRQGSSRSLDDNDSTASSLSENTIKDDSVTRLTDGSNDSLTKSTNPLLSDIARKNLVSALSNPIVSTDFTSRALNFENVAGNRDLVASLSLPSFNSFSSDSLPSSSSSSHTGSDSSPLSIMKVETSITQLDQDVGIKEEEAVKETGAAKVCEEDSLPSSPSLDIYDADSISKRNVALVHPSHRHDIEHHESSVKHIIMSTAESSVKNIIMSTADDEVKLEEAFGDDDTEDTTAIDRISLYKDNLIHKEEKFIEKSTVLSSSVVDSISINADSLDGLENDLQIKNEAEKLLDGQTTQTDSVNDKDDTCAQSLTVNAEKNVFDDPTSDSILNAFPSNSPDSLDRNTNERNTYSIDKSTQISEEKEASVTNNTDTIKDSIDGSFATERDSLFTASSTSSSSSSSSSPLPLPLPQTCIVVEEHNLIQQSYVLLSSSSSSTSTSTYESPSTALDSIANSASIENDSMSYRSAELSSLQSLTPHPLLLQPKIVQIDCISPTYHRSLTPLPPLSDSNQIKELKDDDNPYLQSASAAPSPVRTVPKVSFIKDEIIDTPAIVSLSISISTSIDSLTASVSTASEDSISKDVRITERYKMRLTQRMLSRWRASAFLQSQRRSFILQGFERLTRLLIKRAKAVRFAECELYALSIKRVEAEVKALYARKAALLNTSIDDIASITLQSSLSSDSLLTKGTLSSDSLMFGSPIASQVSHLVIGSPITISQVSSVINSNPTHQATEIAVTTTDLVMINDSDSLHSNHMSDDSIKNRIGDADSIMSRNTEDTSNDIQKSSPIEEMVTSIQSSQPTSTSLDSLDITSTQGKLQRENNDIKSEKVSQPLSTSLDTSLQTPVLGSKSDIHDIAVNNQDEVTVNTPAPSLKVPSMTLTSSLTVSLSESSKEGRTSRNSTSGSSSATVSRRSSAGSFQSNVGTAKAKVGVPPMSPPPSSQTSRSSRRNKGPPVASPTASSASSSSSSSSSSGSTSSSSSSSSRTQSSSNTPVTIDAVNSVDSQPKRKPATSVPKKETTEPSSSLEAENKVNTETVSSSTSSSVDMKSERSSPILTDKSPPTLVRSQRKPKHMDNLSKPKGVTKETKSVIESSSLSAQEEDIRSLASSLSSDSLYPSKAQSLLFIPAASPDSLNTSPQDLNTSPLNLPPIPPLLHGSRLSPDSLTSQSMSLQKSNSLRLSPDSLSKQSPLTIRPSSVSPSFVTINEEKEEDDDVDEDNKVNTKELLGSSLQVSEPNLSTNTSTGLNLWSPPPRIESTQIPVTVSTLSTTSTTETESTVLQTWTAPERSSLLTSKENETISGIVGLTTISNIESSSELNIPPVSSSFSHSQVVPQNEGLLVPPGYVALLMPASRLHGGKDKTKESFENNNDEEDEDETIAVLVPTPSSAGRLNQPRFSGIKSFAGASSSPSAFTFSPTTLELLSDIRGIMRSSE